MKPDGSELPEEVVSAENLAFGELSWSPDGQWLAYSGTCGGECISKVRVDGTQTTFLTSGECGPRVCIATEPEWSPDGEQIAFRSATGLYTMDADGENMRSIGVSGSQPSWRPVVR
jgi:Tol biopolymer transport system component